MHGRNELSRLPATTSVGEARRRSKIIKIARSTSALSREGLSRLFFVTRTSIGRLMHTILWKFLPGPAPLTRSGPHEIPRPLFDGAERPPRDSFTPEPAPPRASSRNPPRIPSRDSSRTSSKNYRGVFSSGRIEIARLFARGGNTMGVECEGSSRREKFR